MSAMQIVQASMVLTAVGIGSSVCSYSDWGEEPLLGNGGISLGPLMLLLLLAKTSDPCGPTTGEGPETAVFSPGLLWAQTLSGWQEKVANLCGLTIQQWMVR
jgi:hypothetical protein